MDNAELNQKVAQYVKEADECIDAQKAEIADLKTQLESQKTATEGSVSVDADAVTAAVNNMVDAGFIKQAEQEQAVSAITADPTSLVGFVSKLASNTIEHNRVSVPSLGKASDTQKLASGDLESDTAWNTMVQNLINK